MSTKLFDPKTSEPKWQKRWEDEKLFQGTIKNALLTKDSKEKFYALYAFAYPSGSGLHVGHVEPMTALDILVRYQRMCGRKVFFPVGWDAFGLPAENYAIKTGIAPDITTKAAIKNFSLQVKRLGISYDWESEIATCHPEYYRWTQWIFIKLFEAGLAYRDKGSVNWCPKDRTVLANEQVVDGKCERCGESVIQKDLEQWKFKITAYQDALIDDLEGVDWPKSTKLSQINWIGRSQGYLVKFPSVGSGRGKTKQLECFTTRLDTIDGVTFVVISPEKFKALGLISLVGDRARAVSDYLDAAAHKTEEQRRVGEKDKTGVDTGIRLAHPLTGEQIPLWIADYVLAGYGTGVVMGVPALDKRDSAFARKQHLPIKEAPLRDASQLLLDHPEIFTKKTTYKLRDWLISRQRYWGAPIPMVHCDVCEKRGVGYFDLPEIKRGETEIHKSNIINHASSLGWYPVPESELPVLLPQVPDFMPTDDGHSPLEKADESWKFVTCPGCGGRARREVDTMDTFVDSSWYFMRYVDARNNKEFASKEALKAWLPVDTYLIGAEHTVLHLLYSRFFTKFLRDLGYLEAVEPFSKMRHQGMILGPDSKKMSKSKGNVINPDDVIEKFGADTLRIYEMFMGPLDADKAWDTGAVQGVYRFLNRIYGLCEQNLGLGNEAALSKSLLGKFHKTLKKVGGDLGDYKYNTAIAAIMEFVNAWSQALNQDKQGLSLDDLADFIKMLSPLAPFISEELYSHLPGVTGSVHLETWPKYDPSKVEDEDVTIVIQVQGKVKGRFTVSQDSSQDKSGLQDLALKYAKSEHLISGDPKNVIVVTGKLVNFVI